MWLVLCKIIHYQLEPFYFCIFHYLPLLDNDMGLIEESCVLNALMLPSKRTKHLLDHFLFFDIMILKLCFLNINGKLPLESQSQRSVLETILCTAINVISLFI